MRFFALILFLLAGIPAYAETPFIWPLACTLGKDCAVTSYADTLEKRGEWRDPGCGDLTEDNRTDTIIALPSITSIADKGVAVRAIADGQIDWAEGRLPDTPSQGCGNGIVIRHKGGFESTYCGLRHGSIPKEAGRFVKQGETIGLAGISGPLPWPGLSFKLTRFNRPYDLLTGRALTAGCRHRDTLVQGLRYTPVTILQAGIHHAPPSARGLQSGVKPFASLPSKSALVIWGYVSGLREGDRMSVTMHQNGKMIWQTGGPVDTHSPLLYARKKAPEGGWPKGTMEAELSITRSGNRLALIKRKILIKD